MLAYTLTLNESLHNKYFRRKFISKKSGRIWGWQFEHSSTLSIIIGHCLPIRIENEQIGLCHYQGVFKNF